MINSDTLIEHMQGDQPASGLLYGYTASPIGSTVGGGGPKPKAGGACTALSLQTTMCWVHLFYSTYHQTTQKKLWRNGQKDDHAMCMHHQ